MPSLSFHVWYLAAGRFCDSPGHLGEPTRLVLFEIVDAALAETASVQPRVRTLPSRMVVYLPLAACLFPELGYFSVACGASSLPGWPGSRLRSRRRELRPLANQLRLHAPPKKRRRQVA